MRKFLVASMALGSLGCVALAGSAQALPLAGVKTDTASSSSVVNVYYRRVCDRDGDSCRRVWVPNFWGYSFHRDHDYRFRHRDHDRDDYRYRRFW